MFVKISVIIPVYNAEDFLEECLDSVISQSIEGKEILCIDDGSWDNSYKILIQYQKRYSYIKVFRQDNKGAGEARNVGLNAASGQYVCFLDADDFYLDPDALNKMVYACETNKLQACAGLRKLYREGVLEEFFWCREYFKYEKNLKGVRLDYRENPDDYFYTNFIFSLEIIKKNGLLFPPYRRYEDPPFFLRVMLQINKYIILPVEFYGYRFPEEALARKETYIEDVLKGIRDNIRIARKNRLYDLEKLLIERISLECVPGIIRNANKEILRLLLEIQSIIFERKSKKMLMETQTVSLDKIITLTKIKMGGFSIGCFFAGRGITNIAIYGLGRYGKIIIEEIRNYKTITVYGVDQEIKEMEGIKIGTLEDINTKCDCIIVSPAKKNEEIVSNIKDVWKGIVWGWNTLIQQIEEYLNITYNFPEK